jgi:Domain of unknown function (DUF4410)
MRMKRGRPRGASIGLFGLVLLTAAVVTGEGVDRTIQDGALDWIHLRSEPPSRESVVVVRAFDASAADLGTGGEGGGENHVAAAAMMQAEAPDIVAKETVRLVKELGLFSAVYVDSGDPLPENALVIEGRFTTLNPGSKAKRYWAGFGAGKGVMEIEGRVTNAAGDLLAEFRQKRLAVIGVFGGDYERKMRADSERFGDDIAEFLRAWTLGESLED